MILGVGDSIVLRHWARSKRQIHERTVVAKKGGKWWSIIEIKIQGKDCIKRRRQGGVGWEPEKDGQRLIVSHGSRGVTVSQKTAESQESCHKKKRGGLQ